MIMTIYRTPLLQVLSSFKVEVDKKTLFFIRKVHPRL